MGSSLLLLVFSAMAIDWIFGDPEKVWERIGHPVSWMGKAVQWADDRLNQKTVPPAIQARNGSVALACLIVVALAAGWLLQSLYSLAGVAGLLAEAVTASVFIAQKSMRDHVAAIKNALGGADIESARSAVARIVGRDTTALDRGQLCRATIESMAENYADGVVAPVFWYAVFGLPGLLAYKAINTADSMIGYKNERHLHFGRTAALTDDLANWVPARLSALLLSKAAGWKSGWRHGARALDVSLRDHGLHRSPNAGWPEAAMAGALSVSLGGPSTYRGKLRSLPYLNGAGRATLALTDVEAADAIFSGACLLLQGFFLIAGTIALLA